MLNVELFQILSIFMNFKYLHLHTFTKLRTCKSTELLKDETLFDLI